MIGGATNSHTLQSGFLLSLHLEQFRSLVVPHFESRAHHVTMANKICFGHKIPHPPALTACTVSGMHTDIQSEAAVFFLLNIWSLF